MATVREDFLSTARVAAELLREPAVATAWGKPSALPEFSVGGLAGHLAYQVFVVPEVLADPVPSERTVSLLGHYERVAWIEADLDDEINVLIRQGGERIADEGPGALTARVDTAVERLSGSLPATADRPVRMGFWGPWSLMLDDLLITRMMELVVHSDDLAVSVGAATPAFGESAFDTVIALLSRLSVRRHGQAAVVRALSRAERAPATIAAF